jgi:DNA-binding response OmpR family regulator
MIYSIYVGVKMKILLVEDDIKLGTATKSLLTYEKCTVDWAQTGTEALRFVKENLESCYDVVILDWMLPELSGIEVCHQLRNKYDYQGGIVFVTAKGELEDCVQALDTGADDFVIKPFKIKELVARLNAVCRRKSRPFISSVYRKENIELDQNLHVVRCSEQELVLRKKEFELFRMLFVNLGNILPRQAIFEKVWTDKLDTNMESLDSHIYSLRKKLKIFPQLQITLVKNIGYVMEIKK